MDSSLVNTESITTVPTKSDLSTATPYRTVTDERANAEEEGRTPPTNNNNNSNTLQKVISTRTFCLFAMSSSIGAGLFVASGSALQRGGPASLVLAFAILGAMVWCVMLALGELSASFPVQGSFYDYSVRFVSESWGFAMGWNYVLNFALIVAFELTVMMMVAELWVLPAGVGVVRSGLVAIVPACMVVLAGIQAFGAKGYGEAEQVFGVLKVLVLMTFVVTGIVIASGGTKEAGGRGFENWQDGRAFLHGLPGFLSNFVAAGMAYGGTEMLGLAAAECKYPRKVMPLGAMVVLARILACYILPLAVLGFVLSPGAFARPEFAHLHVVSPFVVAVRVAGLPALGHVINAVLLVSVFSMANASVFATSRAMVSICRRGMGPRVLGEVTPRGIPRNALVVVFVVAQLAWIAVAPKGAVIFDWLLSVASVSNYFTWGSIFVCHIRMRAAMRHQGRHPEQLAWRSPLGVGASYLGLAVILLSMLAQIVSASLPPVLPTDMARVETLFIGILGFLVVLLFFLGHLLLVAGRSGGKQGGGGGTKKSWRERVWVPMDMLVLPELDARGDGEEDGGGEK